MFENLTDIQLSALYGALNDETDRNHHEPSRVSEEDAAAISKMYSASYTECKKRRIF